MYSLATVNLNDYKITTNLISGIELVLCLVTKLVSQLLIVLYVVNVSGECKTFPSVENILLFYNYFCKLNTRSLWQDPAFISHLPRRKQSNKLCVLACGSTPDRVFHHPSLVQYTNSVTNLHLSTENYCSLESDQKC